MSVSFRHAGERKRKWGEENKMFTSQYIYKVKSSSDVKATFEYDFYNRDTSNIRRA